MSIAERIKWYHIDEVRDMKPLKKKVSITLDEDIILNIKAASEYDDRSFSQYVNLVLREHLENEQIKNKISHERQ